MVLNHRLLLCFSTVLIFCLAGCEEEPVPVIPDPAQPEEPSVKIPYANLFELKVSQSSICAGGEARITLTDLDRKPLEFGNFNFYLSPDIGILNLDSGTYQAPSSLDSAVFVELWAENKKDTSRKSGKILRLHPADPQSNVLTKFSGVNEAVDSKQLPDGSLIFATNSPAEPPGIANVFDFEIFCTDQKGNLLWHNKLGKGVLRRLYVGKDAIYGLGFLNEFVVVKFDFQGNHLATKSLGLESAMDFNLLENLKGSFDEQGDFLIGYGTNSLRMMLKMDKELNLSSAKPIPALGLDFYSLGNSKFLITSQYLDGGFVVTDSELNTLWEKSFVSGTMVISRAIKEEKDWKIWSIVREYSTNSVYLKTFDLDGNQLEDKKLPFPERLFFNQFHDIVQLPNSTIWLVASSQIYPSNRLFLKDQFITNIFHLIQLSQEGNILQETTIESFNFEAPSFPGGWRTKYQGLYQGIDGAILAGQWYYNFLIQLNHDNSFSPC